MILSNPTIEPSSIPFVPPIEPSSIPFLLPNQATSRQQKLILVLLNYSQVGTYITLCEQPTNGDSMNFMSNQLLFISSSLEQNSIPSLLPSQAASRQQKLILVLLIYSQVGTCITLCEQPTNGDSKNTL